MSEKYTCEDCGALMADGGPYGWYCLNGLECPGHARSVAEAHKAVRAATHGECDAEITRLQSALAAAEEQIGFREVEVQNWHRKAREAEQQLAAAQARIAELQAESQKHYSMAVAMFYSGRVDDLTGSECRAAANKIAALMNQPPTAPANC